MARFLGIGFIILAICVAGLWLGLPQFDAKALIAGYLSHRIGRPVTIGALHLTGDYPTHIELDDVHVANVPWGSAPDMVRFDQLTAELDPWLLLHGRLLIDRLTLQGLTIVLERDKNGVGNWKKPGFRASAPKPSPDEVEAEDINQRKQLPAILNMVAANTLVTFRTSSGAILKINLQDFLLHTDAADQPLKLDVTGAYNDVPVKLAVTGASFDELHDTQKPYHARIAAEGGTAAIKLTAAMMDPLNFDGVTGRLEAQIGRLGSTGGFMGETFRADVPLAFNGAFSRHGDHWSLNNMVAQLDDETFKGSVQLDEGARLQPDAIAANLDFADLNVTKLWRQSHYHFDTKADPDALPSVPAQPGILLNAELAAAKFTYHPVTVADLKLHAVIERGRIALEQFSFLWLGGKVEGRFAARADDKSDKIEINLSLLHLDTAQLLSEINAGATPITGELDGYIDLAGYGKTIPELERSGQGYLLAILKDGQLPAKDIKLASTDLTGLFTSNRQMTSLSCLLAFANVQEGKAIIAPLRLKSGQGVILGGGQINLLSRAVDLFFKTDAKSTGFFALDVPIHAMGRWDDIHFAPALSGAVLPDVTMADDAMQRRLPANLRQAAADSGCIH